MTVSTRTATRATALVLATLAGAAWAESARPIAIPSRDLGKAEGRCRAGEAGPAVLVTISGLKDRTGLLRAELYPDDDDDFLQDDKILVREGKTFRRVEIAVPRSGPAQLCVRVPGPGAYTLSLLHDRDSNLKFSLSGDGIGFPNNPKLGFSKPKATSVAFVAGSGLTTIGIVMNYRRGLFGFGPIKG